MWIRRPADADQIFTVWSSDPDAKRSPLESQATDRTKPWWPSRVWSRRPCDDDQIFCNGTESCDEDVDECVSSGDPCGDDQLFCNGTESCDEDADE